MEDLTAIPEAVPDTRRELLDQQFTEVEAAPVEEKSARARDDGGRFAGGKPVKVTAPLAAKEPIAAEAVAPKVADTGAPAAEVKPWHKPPASWKKEYHEAWNKADPTLREYAYQREEQMRAGVEPLLTKAQFADKITEVAKPYMATIQGLGIDVPTAVKGLMEADNLLRSSSPQDKVAYLARLAQNYGVDLRAVAAGQQSEETRVDPAYHTLQQQILQQRGEMAGWKQQQAQVEDDRLRSEIGRFADKSEHFEALRPTMVQLLRGGMAGTLEEAYDKASRLDPNIAVSLQNAQQANSVATQRSAADKAAKTARAAAVSVRGSTPGTPTSSKAQDRRSMLNEQFDNMRERL